MSTRVPEVGDFVKISDTATGEITTVFTDKRGEVAGVVVRESEHRWYSFLVSELDQIEPSVMDRQEGTQ